MRHNQEAIAARCAEKDVPLLGDRVIGVGHQNRQWVGEDGAGFLEVHSMLLGVCGSLPDVPLSNRYATASPPLPPAEASA